MMQDPAPLLNTVTALHDVAPSGFAFALHIRFATPRLLMQTYPAAWRDQYSQNGYVLDDPTVVWAFGASGHARWRDLLADDRLGMFAMAARHGLHYGLCLSGQHAGSHSIGSVTRPDRDYTDAEIGKITALFNELQAQTLGLDSLPPRVTALLQAA